MLRLPIPVTPRLTGGRRVARRFHYATRLFYGFGIREKIPIPKSLTVRNRCQIVLHILCVLPNPIVNAREGSCFCDLLDIGIMRSFVHALKSRQTRYMCETNQ